MVVSGLLIALAVVALLYPLITVAQTTSTVATVVFSEGSTTQDEFLVASSIPSTPTPQELVKGAFYDAPVMVRIAKAESSFVPTAKNPTTTATGLFQILIGTWKSYGCTGERTDAADNIACARKIYDQNGTSAWNSSKDNWE